MGDEWHRNVKNLGNKNNSGLKNVHHISEDGMVIVEERCLVQSECNMKMLGDFTRS